MRLRWLCEDVKNTTCFEEYIEKLHKSGDQALFCTYKRPWPSWLSDTVLYGLKDNVTKQSEWLWAVTTSYRPGSDLMSLQFHRMTERTMSDKYVFPWAYRSFVQLADKTTDLEQDREIRKLATLITSGAEESPLQPATPATPQLPPTTGASFQSIGLHTGVAKSITKESQRKKGR